MKITKGLFKTSIEIEPGELRLFQDANTFNIWYGFFKWIKDTFKLDILTEYKK